MPAPQYTPKHVRERGEARHMRLVGLGYKDYDDYLRSPAWRNVRRRYAEERPWICHVCGKTDGLALHHRTYERVGAERIDDLMPLCGHCHELVHVLERRGDTNLDFDGVIDLERAVAGMAENQARAERLLAEREQERQTFLTSLEELPVDERIRRALRAAEIGTRRNLVRRQLHLFGLMLGRGKSRDLLLRHLRRAEQIAYRLD